MTDTALSPYGLESVASDIARQSDFLAATFGWNPVFVQFRNDPAGTIKSVFYSDKTFVEVSEVPAKVIHGVCENLSTPTSGPPQMEMRVQAMGVISRNHSANRAARTQVFFEPVENIGPHQSVKHNRRQLHTALRTGAQNGLEFINFRVVSAVRGHVKQMRRRELQKYQKRRGLPHTRRRRGMIRELVR